MVTIVGANEVTLSIGSVVGCKVSKSGPIGTGVISIGLFVGSFVGLVIGLGVGPAVGVDDGANVHFFSSIFGF